MSLYKLIQTAAFSFIARSILQRAFIVWLFMNLMFHWIFHLVDAVRSKVLHLKHHKCSVGSTGRILTPNTLQHRWSAEAVEQHRVESAFYIWPLRPHVSRSKCIFLGFKLKDCSNSVSSPPTTIPPAVFILAELVSGQWQWLKRGMPMECSQSAAGANGCAAHI